MSITIDEEFRSLIPPLSADEYTQLEKNILKDGIRDPLVVWKTPSGNEILVDGHNRKRIADAHPGITYKVEYMTFDLRSDVIAWIVDNQLGRRNLHPLDQERLLSAKREALATKARKRMSDGAKGVEIFPQAKTRDIIGKEIGVSGRQVDKLHIINEKANEQTKQQVRSGEKSVNQAYNEIRNKEIKRPPSAKEYADQAKERHEDFQKQSVVSVADIKKDQRDKEIIEQEVVRRIKKTLGAINELYVLIDAGEVPVNILSDEGKKIVIGTLAEMQNRIDMIGNIVGKR